MTDQVALSRPPRAVSALLSTLAYADIFDHPLRFEEIRRYFPCAISPQGLRALIEENRPVVERITDYYLLTGRGAIAQTRMRREVASRRLWYRARPWLHAVAALPFVRMVALTGSLAAQSAGESADIDLFVVTAPGFLWTCRAMILLLARLSGLRLCPNYLVTERALELPAQSFYVARELVQMVPLSGSSVYARIREINGWTGDYLPNAGGPPASFMRLQSVPLLPRAQHILEVMLRMLPLRIVEEYEMRRKISMLQREQGTSPEAFFSADVCKGHVDRHGIRIEARFTRRLADIESMAIDSPVKMEVQR